MSSGASNAAPAEAKRSEHAAAANNSNLGKGKHLASVPTHIQKLLVEGVLKFHCSICQKSFRSRSQQYYHFGCGDEAAKKYKCAQCQKCFSSRSHLNYHMESHVSEIYHCAYCNKSFSNQRVLKKHEKSIHQSEPISCEQCEKIFRSKCSLKSHLEQHCQNLRFHCNECDKKYASKSSLQQHMQKHLSKRFSCDTCGKSFLRNSTLKMHIQRHAKTNSFVCDICLRTFNDTAALLRHTKIHNDAVRYSCRECNIVSTRKDNMLRHVRNMHQGEDFECCIEILKPATITRKSGAENTLDNAIESSLSVPKTVENSSVIKFVGNVEPVKIPNSDVDTMQGITDGSDSLLTPLLSTVDKEHDPNESGAHQKCKKKYDPIEMYRRILIDDDDDDGDDEIEQNQTDAIEDSIANAATDTSAAVEKSTAQQRSMSSTSNFSEMHWRKNFKYTYEFQEY